MARIIAEQRRCEMAGPEKMRVELSLIPVSAPADAPGLATQSWERWSGSVRSAQRP
jgi:hypothetical protein